MARYLLRSTSQGLVKGIDCDGFEFKLPCTPDAVPYISYKCPSLASFTCLCTFYSKLYPGLIIGFYQHSRASWSESLPPKLLADRSDIELTDELMLLTQ